MIERVEGAKVGIVAFGSTEPAIQEARHQLDGMGVATSYMRVRAVPFNEDVEAFIRDHEQHLRGRNEPGRPAPPAFDG